MDGLVWSPEGYRDPSIRNVVFGLDTHFGSYGGQMTNDPWVVYAEPRLSGNYSSGYALRLEDGSGGCQMTMWDPSADRAVWPAAVAIPCPAARWHPWTIAGGTLIFSMEKSGFQFAGPRTVFAYNLADGQLLWQKQGSLGIAGWDMVRDGVNMPVGVSWDIVTGVFGGLVEVDDTWTQINDGVSVLMPTGVAGASDAMVYTAQHSSGGSTVISAYDVSSMNTVPNPTAAWSADLPITGDNIWTFATGGTMYVAATAANGVTQICPLVAS